MATDTVLVVGAGPVGLITALGLAKAGVPVTVVERAPSIIASPRAIVYHWAVLQGLDELGLLDDALMTGFKKQEYSYMELATGKRIDYSLDVLEGHTSYPYNLHIGQHLLAEIALRRLELFPHADVRWSTELVELDQDDDCVTVGVRSNGESERIRASWVIGADGAASSVRKALGVGFEGHTWPTRFVAVNLRYDFEQHGYARTTFLVDGTYGAVIAKLSKDGLWRCTYSEPSNLPIETVRQRMPEYFDAILPAGAELNIDAYSPYRVHQRSATTYKTGRVLLAGDAAHATNPSGGFGLTSGMLDAFALHEALTAVTRREADEKVLERYAAERRRVFLEVVSPASTESKRVVFDTRDAVRRQQDIASIEQMATKPELLLERLLRIDRMRSPSFVTDIGTKL